MIFSIGFGDVLRLDNFFGSNLVIIDLIISDNFDDLSLSEFGDITEDLTKFIVIPPIIAGMTKDKHITRLRSTGIRISDNTTLQLFLKVTLFQLFRCIIM
jgi:hypothetical protein